MTNFYIGCTPSMANQIINPDFPASGLMISVNQLRKRKSNFKCDRAWIMDSGAFTEISRFGRYRFSPEEYWQQVCRWAECNHLIMAISQDWMCEPFILKKTGLSIADHQRLTIDRYDALQKFTSPATIPIMPVLQGYQISDYLQHLYDYGDRLNDNHWVGVGSVCRRNGNPGEIIQILKSIKLIKPGLRLHGFGLKLIALQNPEIQRLLYSADSMAWSYPKRFGDSRSELELAYEYQEKIAAGSDYVRNRPPRTAGAGNGQGRKSKWRSPTKAIRVPEKYSDRLIKLAKEWEKQDNQP